MFTSFNLLLNYTGPGYCIFVHDEDGRNVQGGYEMIMKRPTSAEDYIEWNTDENDKKYVCVLGVSHFISFFQFSLIH